MSEIRDEAEALRWFDEGRTLRWMSEEYERRYNEVISPATWAEFRRRRRNQPPLEGDDTPRT